MDEKRKIRVRKGLIKGMCYCAENVHRFNCKKSNVEFMSLLEAVNTILHITREDTGHKFVAFKPGISDKLLMKRMINAGLDVFYEESKSPHYNNEMGGTNLMNLFYYSQYGWWDEKCLEEAREY